MLLLDRIKTGFSAMSSMWQPPHHPPTVASRGFTASAVPGEPIKTINEYRSATPEARAEFHLRHPKAKPAVIAAIANPTPHLVKYPAMTPTRSASSKPKSFSGIALAAMSEKLTFEVEELTRLAGRALARVRQEKARAEIASLTGLDKTRAVFKAQLSKSGLLSQSTGSATPDGVGQESAAVKRSKPSQNPAFQPQPNRDVRLKESNAHFSQLAKETDLEIEQATKRGKIPQELLARRRRIDADWRKQNDNIMSDK
jgi:hypothetical protein